MFLTTRWTARFIIAVLRFSCQPAARTGMNPYNLALLLGLLVAVTPESIPEAIRLGSDEKASGKLQQSYTVQSRAGMGAYADHAATIQTLVRGSSAMTHRKGCVVPLSVNEIR